MSDEGTTQDALKRLKQVDPERYAEIMDTFDQLSDGLSITKIGYPLRAVSISVNTRDYSNTITLTPRQWADIIDYVIDRGQRAPD